MPWDLSGLLSAASPDGDMAAWEFGALSQLRSPGGPVGHELGAPAALVFRPPGQSVLTDGAAASGKLS